MRTDAARERGWREVGTVVRAVAAMLGVAVAAAAALAAVLTLSG